MAEQLTCNQQVVGSNPTHGSHWDCCVPNVDALKWTSRSTSVVIIVVLFFHVNSNLIYNIMTLITLPSGTVLANDYTLPIIVVSKVLMANDNNPHAKLYPYYFTIMYANGVSIPIIAKTLAEVELDRQIVVKAITPTKDSNVN